MHESMQLLRLTQKGMTDSIYILAAIQSVSCMHLELKCLHHEQAKCYHDFPQDNRICFMGHMIGMP